MEKFAQLLDNIIKGPIMSLVGLGAMLGSAGLWFYEYLSDWQAVVFATLGFMLLFMKDEIPGYLRSLIKKKAGLDNDKKAE